MYRQFLEAAAAATSNPASETLTPGIIRFTLEYRDVPDPEVERRKLAGVIGSDRFAFFRLPPGEDPLVRVLQFPGVVRQQSSTFLFDVAQHLVDDCGLASCVPDVDPGWIADDELGHFPPESVGGIVWTLCKSHAAVPPERRWAVSAVKADRAWAAFGTTGQGILIGQPDTGVADHRELDGAIDIRKGTDVIAGGGLPIDPLSPSMGSPGHGTATSSAAVSRPSLEIVGVAPGATLVPIRCVNSVIIGSGAAVAAAIDHARLVGCGIVSMSLGGPIEGPDLRRAIERAVNAGMIVLAAAGNCVHAVVYPAWDANVIAVAGVDVDDQPWKGTSHGPKVDISAPGENVYVARRHWPSDTDKSLVEPGQGTSFAVAITAGCAALWLAKHSPEAVRAEARKRNITVQSLFRSAVRETSRKPARWPSKSMGAGIVDAERLLAMPLADIPAPPSRRNANPGEPLLEAIPDSRRFVAEAGFLALDHRQRSDPKRIGALESPAAPRPSQAFAAALKASGLGAALLGSGAARTAITPLTPFIGPRTPSARLVPRGAPDLRGETPPPVTVRKLLARSGKKDMLDRIESVLNRQSARIANTESADRTRREIMAQAEQVVDAWARGANIRAESIGAARATAEAIVRLTDRPALRVVNGMIDPQDPQLEHWAGDLGPPRKVLKPLIDAVGRIDIAGPDGHSHVGTGTVIGKGVVMTNRHVIEAFAEPIPSTNGHQAFLLNASVSICFDEAAKDEARRFAIKSVLTAGPWKIGEFADVGKLDVALLEVETTNVAGADLPGPVPSGPLFMESPEQSRLIVVGYPAKPGLSAAIDPDTGEVSIDVWDRFWELFGDEYGTKYLSPGQVSNKPGEIVGDERGWAFSHDATTLAGNSGAPVISLRHPYRIGGLHFGGQTLRQNLAHDLSGIRTVVRDETRLLDLASFGAFFDAA
ncbi:S8 family serine peptidase [Mesorhizobium sp. LHD-90]|uniref:S8 family serine peptidase n=1 Tax=Mesorhizobium sp. LHD-90 TaxID=3071414 RepID=UPI0027DF861C|nr:S8 family serine peptidase [Mesorhizobium sp. LHD-90]MDQ6434253.1 S8 family serine peptidase [Mesorhizobium sp. LHD-90]